MNKEGRILEALEEISRKLDSLDKLVALWKLANKEALEKIQAEIEEDDVAKAILEHADGSLNYSDLVDKAAEEVAVAKVTVRRRFSWLADMQVIKGERKGRSVYYKTTNLLE